MKQILINYPLVTEMSGRLHHEHYISKPFDDRYTTTYEISAYHH